MYLLASSLTATLLDGLSEHPLNIRALSPTYYGHIVSHKNRVFLDRLSIDLRIDYGFDVIAESQDFSFLIKEV